MNGPADRPTLAALDDQQIVQHKPSGHSSLAQPIHFRRDKARFNLELRAGAAAQPRSSPFEHGTAAACLPWYDGRTIRVVTDAV